MAPLSKKTDLVFNSFHKLSTSYCGPTRLAGDIRKIGEINVSLTTVDNFCKNEKIQYIDILKIDIEGAELKVLKGSQKKLTNSQIGIIYTEVMFTPTYEGGAMFCELCEFLLKFHYTLFDISDLHRSKTGQLVWGNAIFIGPKHQKI